MAWFFLRYSSRTQEIDLQCLCLGHIQLYLEKEAIHTAGIHHGPRAVVFREGVGGSGKGGGLTSVPQFSPPDFFADAIKPSGEFRTKRTRGCLVRKGNSNGGGSEERRVYLRGPGSFPVGLTDHVRAKW